MKLVTTLLAVRDIEVSKEFYCNVFNQTITLDLGRNVSFSGGFSIQEDFAWLVDLDDNSVVYKPHNMELYFEVDDFDEFIKKLERNKEIEYVNKPMMHEWKQRVVRIYDPDFHIIEIGESMQVIAKRYLSQGYTVEKTAEIIQHPVEFVNMCLDK